MPRSGLAEYGEITGYGKIAGHSNLLPTADPHAVHAADHRLVATEDGANHVIEQAHVLPVLAWGPGISLRILARVAARAKGLRARAGNYDSDRCAIIAGFA